VIYLPEFRVPDPPLPPAVLGDAPMIGQRDGCTAGPVNDASPGAAEAIKNSRFHARKRRRANPLTLLNGGLRASFASRWQMDNMRR
jgi:hypothetical protein